MAKTKKAISNTEFNKVISEAFKDPYSRQEEWSLIKKHEFTKDERTQIRKAINKYGGDISHAPASKSVRRYVRKMM